MSQNDPNRQQQNNQRSTNPNGVGWNPTTGQQNLAGFPGPPPVSPYGSPVQVPVSTPLTPAKPLSAWPKHEFIIALLITVLSIFMPFALIFLVLGLVLIIVVVSRPRTMDVVGEVRGIQTRTEHFGRGQIRYVWAFDLVAFDNVGNQVQTLPVEMRGSYFQGSISEGNQVAISGKWKAGRPFLARQILNVKTGVTTTSNESRSKGLLILLYIFLIPVVLNIGVGVVMLIMNIGSPHSSSANSPNARPSGFTIPSLDNHPHPSP